MPWKDPEKKKKLDRERVARRRRDWVAANGPCKECGSKRHLQVDHIDPKKKVDHRIWSWSEDRRETELAKCQVLCRDCHQEKTSLENAPPHGTNQRYTSSRWRCRCQPCRDAHAVKNAELRARVA